MKTPMAKHPFEEQPKPARFCDLIGIRFVDLESGFCRTELAVTKAHLNPYGSLHGGVVYALADTAMGGALSTLLKEKEQCSTIEIKINYLRAVGSGRLICDAKVLHKRNKIAFLEATVWDSERNLTATAAGTFMIFFPSSLSEKR